MSLRRAACASWALCALALTGCSGGDELPEAGAGNQGSLAIFQVNHSRFEGEPMGARFDYFQVSGRIARFAGIDRERVARILSVEELDEPSDLDACEGPAPVSLDEDVVPDEMGRAEVELEDVGPLELRAADQPVRLEPQSFPGLLNVISGAVYVADDREGVEWEPRGEYSFAAAGRGETGSFEIAASAPEDLVVLRIGGDDPLLSIPAIDRSLDLPIRWEDGDPRDIIRIDLSWTQMGTEMRLRCQAHDDGRFTIPSSALRLLPDGSFAASARAAIHRLRRHASSVPGIDEAVLLFDVSETFPIRIQ